MAEKLVRKENKRFLSHHFTPTKKRHQLLQYTMERLPTSEDGPNEQPSTSASTNTSSAIIYHQIKIERMLKKNRKKC